MFLVFEKNIKLKVRRTTIILLRLILLKTNYNLCDSKGY
jgi:hypothetical protein